MLIAQRFSDGQIAWETPLPVDFDPFGDVPEAEITMTPEETLSVQILPNGPKFKIRISDGHLENR